MTASLVSVLVVEDDGPIRRLLRTSLGGQGYRVGEAASAAAALAAFAAERPDLVLLDLGLPDRDGIDLIREWRAAGEKAAIIVMSSRDDERGKVEALDLGADDYVTKPFGMAELVARMRTALRHRIQAEGAEPVLSLGGLIIDLPRRVVTRAGADVKLSNQEWDILKQLALSAGRVVTHRALMAAVWGPSVDVQYLRVYVRQLRQKLEDDPEQPRHILTETGIGYRLAAP